MEGQYYILLVGHIASGKTTLSNEIVKTFNVNRVSNDDIRELMISNVAYFSDAHYSYVNDKAWSLSRIAYACNTELIKELLINGESFLLDGGGITMEKRRKNIESAKQIKEDIKTIIIEVSANEEILLERLTQRDKSNDSHRWVDFYKNIRKKQFEPVENDEADFVLRCNQDNVEQVIAELNEILKEGKCEVGIQIVI